MGFRYYELLRKTGSLYYLRLKIIDKLKENNGNIYKTAKELSTSRNTVRKVWQAYRQKGWEALNGKKAGNPHPPKKISETEEKKIVSEYQKVKISTIPDFRTYYNSQFHCNLSLKVFYRVLKTHQFYSRIPKTRSHHKIPLTKLQKKVSIPLKSWRYGVKDLSNIIKYFLQAKKLKLPLYQICFQDTVSGAAFIFYTYSVSIDVLINTFLFFFWHLKGFGVPNEDLTIQIDNNFQIAGDLNRKKLSIFTKMVNQFGSECTSIFPDSSNKNKYSEDFHDICEVEFYEIERFHDITDFYEKAITWFLRYNFIRKKKTLGGRAPIEIIKEHYESLDERFFAAFTPLTFLGSEPFYEKFYGNNLKKFP